MSESTVIVSDEAELNIHGDRYSIAHQQFLNLTYKGYDPTPQEHIMSDIFAALMLLGPEVTFAQALNYYLEQMDLTDITRGTTTFIRIRDDVADAWTAVDRLLNPVAT